MEQPLFYKHFARDPFFNMAFDEWMFGHACRTPGWIGLRLYSWNEGAITIGFNQTEELALDMSRLGKTPLIRRITGGRALFHEPSELTYAIAVNTKGLDQAAMAGSLSRTITFVSEALVGFLQECGVEARFVGRGSNEDNQRHLFHKAPCFASHARYEVVSGQDKIIASAQRRIGDTVFQHGSIKVGGVGDHPAVPVRQWVSSDHDPVVVVDQSSFVPLAQSFRTIFEKRLRMKFLECESDLPQAAEALARRLSEVRKKPLQRRDIF